MAQIVENLEVEELTLEEARATLGNYDFAIVHMISQMQYGEIDSINVNWEELLELRAFNDKEELHVFDRNGESKAVHVFETGNVKDIIIKSYLMRNGKKLVVKEYLQPDEDGQAVASYNRPFSMK
ncbi:hypothetical protein [Blautia marasmi]|uniref:hypothetical protein n=1 Tax=Blautia marasmi TaxID=1917868 RepID=UPI00266C893D|nr:hypothetical protein [Blautia marasmi]